MSSNPLKRTIDEPTTPIKRSKRSDPIFIPARYGQGFWYKINSDGSFFMTAPVIDETDIYEIEGSENVHVDDMKPQAHDTIYTITPDTLYYFTSPNTITINDQIHF